MRKNGRVLIIAMVLTLLVLQTRDTGAAPSPKNQLCGSYGFSGSGVAGMAAGTPYPRVVEAAAGTLVSDCNGSLTINQTLSGGGYITSNSGQETYSVNVDGTGTAQPIPGLGATIPLAFVIDSKKSEVRFVALTPAGYPETWDFTAVKQNPPAPYTNASLVGSYGVSCRGSLSDGKAYAAVAEFNSDGLGNSSGTATYVIDTVPTAGTFSGTYSVNPDGSFTGASTFIDTGGTFTVAGVLDDANKEIREVITTVGTIIECTGSLR